MKGKAERRAILLSALLLCLLLLGAGWLLLPYEDYNGTDWRAFRAEPENTVDVLYIGSSLVFCNIDPTAVYLESGLTGYVVAGPEQSVPISYAYLREAGRTQAPQAVFLELNGLFYSSDETFTLSDIAFMPRGINRLRASISSAGPESWPGLLFPLLNYHDYWVSFSPALLRARLHPTVELQAGFHPQTAVKPLPASEYRQEYPSFYPAYLETLRDCAAWCRERGTALYLFYAPTYLTASPALKEQLRADLSDQEIAGWIDFTEAETAAAVGLDPETDWADKMHLNLQGAEKLSLYLADFLRGEGFAPAGTADATLWQRRLQAREALLADEA